MKQIFGVFFSVPIKVNLNYYYYSTFKLDIIRNLCFDFCCRRMSSKFSNYFSIKFKNYIAGMSTFYHCIIILTDCESTVCVDGNDISIDTFKNKCKIGHSMFANQLIWIQYQFIVTGDDTMYAA